MAKGKLPDAAHVTDTLGWAHYKLGLTDSAVTLLQDAVHRAPTVALYKYHLGMAYLAARRVDSARQSLRAALATGDKFPGAVDAKAALLKISAP
jgi:Flp pilus assembly protein TadD